MIAHPPYGYLPDGDGPALCRRFCRRLAEGRLPPRGGRDGLALCRAFCRGFAAGLPTIAARRPRRRQRS